MMFDPPEGWKYGFPMELPIEVINNDKSLTEFLREKSYPEDLIPLALTSSRYWEEENA